MFYWIIAIPFLVALAIFSISPTSNTNMKRIEDNPTNALAFRMSEQHSAAMKVTMNYIKNGGSVTINDGFTFDEVTDFGSFLPRGFIPDVNKITTKVRCLALTNQDGLGAHLDCRASTVAFVYVYTILNKDNAGVERWLAKKEAFDLGEKIFIYRGSVGGVAAGLVRELPAAPSESKVPVGSKRGIFKFFKKSAGSKTPVYGYLPAAICCTEGDLLDKAALVSQIKGQRVPFPKATNKCGTHNIFAE